jgi:hypothetical protein
MRNEKLGGGTSKVPQAYLNVNTSNKSWAGNQPKNKNSFFYLVIFLSTLLTSFRQNISCA